MKFMLKLKLKKKSPPREQVGRRVTARLCAVVAALFLAVGAASDAQERPAPPEFDRSAWRGDGFPLQPNRDADALRTIWATLESSPPTRPFAKAVTLQLLKQGGQYKGKLLAVEGRLLRAERKKLSENETYYDVWVLLPDTKNVPIRLITRRAPEGFAVDDKPLPTRAEDPNVEYRHETLKAAAVYYRTTAYDAGVDFLAAPTLVAEDFTVAAPDVSERVSAPRSSGWLLRGAILLAVVAAWLVFRRLTKNKRRGGPSATTVALLFALATVSAARADEGDGAEFWGSLAGISTEEWRLETTENRPSLHEGTPESAKRRAAALAILAIPERLLADDVLLDRVEKGDVKTLHGTLQALDDVALSPIEGDRVGVEAVRRAVVALDGGGVAAFYLTKTPSFVAPSSFFDRPRDATETPGIGERVAALGIDFGTEADDVAAFLATRLEWRPESAPLGRAGVDLAAFESVPVYRYDALETAKSREERRRVARAMRWTTEDRRAFYGALAGYADPRSAPKDARAPVGVVSLFNTPERSQGARASLAGWVRRVNMILISDPEVKAATGLDRYYQLFLFTNESQGWPVVLCVPTLPDGLEPGGGAEYRREIEFDGFFYKTWAYKSSAKDSTTPEEVADDEAEDQKAVRRWTRAPVLIGRVTSVKPLEDSPAPPWSPTEIFATFAVLACAWIALRRVVASRRKTSTSRRIKP